MQQRTVTASGLYAFVTSNVTLVACVSLAQAQAPAVRIVPATPVRPALPQAIDGGAQ